MISYALYLLTALNLTYRKSVKYDHPGECSPEKDCL